MSYPFSVAGKKVLITGGTAGIGLAVARGFAGLGANVAITGRRSSGDQIARQVGAQFIRMDLSDATSISPSIQRAAEIFDKQIDVIFLNAGVDLPCGTIEDIDLAAMATVYQVNVFGLVQCLRDALPCLHRGSSVIVSSSPAAQLNAPGMAAYSSAKAAVNSIVRSFASELAPRGIRVNAILPGIVASEMSSGDSGNANALRHLTLTGAFRQPEELLGTVQFLASQASSPVTGALIGCDDGMSASLSQEIMRRLFDPHPT